MEDKKSFWTTLPGILTGIAALITALGGFITLYYQIREKPTPITHTEPKPADDTYKSPPVLITGPTDYFDAKTGDAKVYYYISSDGTIELYSRPGFNPRTGGRLRPITPEIANRYDDQLRKTISPQPQKAQEMKIPEPPSAGRWPWTSHRFVREDDLKSLSGWELTLMRNEIYARHGRLFNRQDLADYFNNQPWYKPKGMDVDIALNPIERQNTAIILKYQERQQHQ